MSDAGCLSLVLQALTREQTYEAVRSVVARDASGSFGLMAGHEPTVACLQPGLLRFRDAQRWYYAAQSGAVLWCRHNRVRIACGQFLVCDELDPLLPELEAQWQVIQQTVRDNRRSAVQIEQAMARKLLALGREGDAL